MCILYELDCWLYIAENIGAIILSASVKLTNSSLTADDDMAKSLMYDNSYTHDYDLIHDHLHTHDTKLKEDNILIS